MCRSPNSSANHGIADGTRSAPATFCRKRQEWTELISSTKTPEIPHRRGRSVLVPVWAFKQRLLMPRPCSHREKLIRQRSLDVTDRTHWRLNLGLPRKHFE